MIQAALLLLALGPHSFDSPSFGGGFGRLAQDKQEKQKLTVTVRDSRTTDKKPAFHCEGAADLPDDCRIDVILYIGAPSYSSQLERKACLVQGGKYAIDFVLFSPENLAGEYVARAIFEPGLQGVPFDKLPPLQSADAPLRIGDAAEIERKQNEVRARLAGEIKAVGAIADDVVAQFRAAKGKPDPKAWAKLTDDWLSRCLAIEKRVQLVFEYRALGLFLIADDGLEHLRNILLRTAEYAGLGRERDLKEGMVIFERAKENYLSELSPKQDPAAVRKACRELAEDLRRQVRESLALSDDPLRRARRRFIDVTLQLDRKSGAAHHDAIRAVVATGTALYAALEDKKPGAKELHERLDKEIEALLQAFQREPGDK